MSPKITSNPQFRRGSQYVSELPNHDFIKLLLINKIKLGQIIYAQFKYIRIYRYQNYGQIIEVFSIINLLEMEERENVQVLYLGTITHENDRQAQGSEKTTSQDEISFVDPVQIELIRIPNHGKEMYSRLTSQTQKEPIKSLEIYYRNLDKKMARYSLLVCSSSELLVSSSIDILVTLKETIYTDLLVIRGNFTNITFCIYGRVVRSKEEIEKKCFYFNNNIDITLREQQPSIKINRNIFNESRERVKAIEDQYSETTQQQKVYNWDGYSNDHQIYDSQIKNICKISQQIQVFEDLGQIQERSVTQIRRKIESLQSLLSKLFKSAHIGLYYPTPYRATMIPEAIPKPITKIAIKLLSQSLSDQYRSLEVLKLILQLAPLAQQFVKLNGIEALIRLFFEFFTSNMVILSSLKILIVEVFIVLSFWQFSAQKLVDRLPALFQDSLSKPHSVQSQQKFEQDRPSEKSKQKSRSRQKKKKRSHDSQSRSGDREKKRGKKEKKSKKNRDRSRSKEKGKDKQREREREKSRKRSKNRSQEKDKGKSKQRERQRERDKSRKRSKNRSEDKGKQKKQGDRQRQKDAEKQFVHGKKQDKENVDSEAEKIKQKILDCQSFYEILFEILRFQKNSKIQQLIRILLLQITQTLTRNASISNEIAKYTPLLRDTKYMFNQGGQMINSKTLKTFASFSPFLNYEQSVNVDSIYICQSEKIKQPNKYGISPKLFKLIDSALSILQSKGEEDAPVMFDQYFMTLISALIDSNKNGIAIGLSNFIDTIKVENLLGLKKQEAVIAIVCEYIHQVLIEDDGMNLIFYLDQIHNSMIKIINWLKEDKTFSLQIKRKVQYLINSALIYNHFSGTQNNFKSFSEYFIKLIGHQNLDINKIVQYNRKQYNKTVYPLSFTNLSENFGVGNFYDVLPAQPLLQIDICLKMLLAILKLNKNVWTVFYEFKFVPAFSTLYLKLHSLLKFFFTPSLQRQNVFVDLKMVERLINNYLQVLKHLTNIFIYKIRYESAFNELTEEDDIYYNVELYEKWVDTYIFLYYGYFSENSLISQQKSYHRIKELLANFVELFEIIFKGYELTKFKDRQNTIKSILKYAYRQHYQSITFRSGILSLLKLFVTISQQNTSEVIVNYLLQKNMKNEKDSYDILLPDNQKSIFQNILKKNIYRSDKQVIQNLSGFITQLLKKDHTKQKIYEILESILDEIQFDQCEDLDEVGSVHSLTFEKNTLYINLLSFVKSPMNNKIEQHIFRLYKNLISFKNKNSHNQSKKLKLRNAYLRFIKNSIQYNKNFSSQTFIQYLKSTSYLMQFQIYSDTAEIRVDQAKGVLIFLESLIQAANNLNFQSILLFGEYVERPSKAMCQFNLEKVFSYFKAGQHKQMGDQRELLVIKEIGISACYLLCKLTTIDGFQFFSTQSRKNALSYFVSPQKLFTIQDILNFLDDLAPRQILETLRNYLDFPIIEKPQITAQNEEKVSDKKTMGALYSKGVFTMISQNDPIGRTRFELIQDRWEGGSIEGQMFKVNSPLSYLQIISEKIVKSSTEISYEMRQYDLKFKYFGIHEARSVNNLFHFKIRKIFSQQAKKNAVSATNSILMKNIPSEIKKPQNLPIKDQSSYQAKINSSPSINKNVSLPNPSNPLNQPPNIPQNKANYPAPSGVMNPQIRGGSTGNNRSPSPYNNNNNPKVGAFSSNQPQNYGTYNHGNSHAPQGVNQGYYQPPNSVGYKQYPPNYDPHLNQPIYNSTNYYPNTPYQPGVNYPTGYIHPGSGYPRNIPPQPMVAPGYGGYPPVYPQPNNQQRQIEQSVREAISILVSLQQSPNHPEAVQLKAKVNRLFQLPTVHGRVQQYFKQVKKN